MFRTKSNWDGNDMKTKCEKYPKNLFTVSSQYWKFAVMIILTIVQLILVVLMIVSFSQPKNPVFTSMPIDGPIISLFSVAHSMIWIPWFAFSLRCPKCKKAMVWHIMRKSAQSRFVLIFVQMLYESCPACGVKWESLEKSNVPTGHLGNE